MYVCLGDSIIYICLDGIALCAFVIEHEGDGAVVRVRRHEGYRPKH